MDEHQIELSAAALGNRLARRCAGVVLGRTAPAAADRLGRWQNWLYTGGVVVVAFALFALANVALTLHDGHIDLTREKLYTPSAAAMKVVDGLEREVRLTYFYHSQDPAGRRARDILTLMQRRNPLFRLTAVDPTRSQRWRAAMVSASTTRR